MRCGHEGTAFITREGYHGNYSLYKSLKLARALILILQECVESYGMNTGMKYKCISLVNIDFMNYFKRNGAKIHWGCY